MSDIRAQSRRDAEFDLLLLAITDGTYLTHSYSEASMRKAYEMGKRHGREDGRSELLREIERERHIAMEGN